MATNNARNNKGQFPVGSTVTWDFTAPADTRWLLTNGASVSKTTYAPLYALQGDAYEGTGNLTEVSSINGGANIINYFPKWHPSSNYVAYAILGSSSTKDVGVSSFDGSTLTQVSTAGTGNNGTQNVAWHPNGNFLAVVGVGTATYIYSWNGSNTLTEVESVTTTNQCNMAAWSPNGNYLVIGEYTTGLMIAYSWNGSDTLTQVTTATISGGGTLNAMEFSPDGNYLSVGSSKTNYEMQVFTWNGSNALTYLCLYQAGTGRSTSGQWDPSGKYILYGISSTTNQLSVLYFDGSTLTLAQQKTMSASGGGWWFRWSKGGNNIIGTTNDGGYEVSIVSWNSATTTLTILDSVTQPDNGSIGADINYTNNYYANACSPASTPYKLVAAGTTGLTSNDYRTNFLLPTTATSIIRGK